MSTPEMGGGEPVGYGVATLHFQESDFTGDFLTRSGRTASIRLLQPEDGELLLRLFHALSPETRRLRFNMTPADIDEEQIARVAWRLADVDNRTLGGAVLALVSGPAGAEPIGVARLARPPDQPGATTAEGAIVVRDDYQNEGVGTVLLHLLVRLAHRMDVHTIQATVRADNRSLFAVLRNLPHPVEMRTSRGETEVRIDVYPL